MPTGAKNSTGGETAGGTGKSLVAAAILSPG